MSVEHLPVGDEDLMMLIRNDDTRAFEASFDRHSPVAFNLAMRILNDRGLAADVTQEAFLKFWRLEPLTELRAASADLAARDRAQRRH